MELYPVSKDSTWGPYRVYYLASIYMEVGEHEDAIDQLEVILSRPGPFSVSYLRMDPCWIPLRKHPRFQKLLQGDVEK